MYEDSHLEAQYEDTISEVAQDDRDYWNDKYDFDDEEMNDDE